MKKIKILDSTLRDGAQGQGISFSVADKIKIIKALDFFGVDHIEAGYPASNPKDEELFEKLKNVKLKNAKLCAFGRTSKSTHDLENDEELSKLIASNTPTVCIFGKSSAFQAEKVLGISKEENLSLIKATLEYLKTMGKEIIFDAEHFYSGYRQDSEYAMQVLKTAFAAGADVLCLCDTTGDTMPMQAYEITKAVCESFPSVEIGVHFHDDTGCAVANSLLAVNAGAVQIQGTFLGFGERCGNADLSVIIPDLYFKYGIDFPCDMRALKATANQISEISNVRIRSNKPYIGKSAFHHKAGMHVDAVKKCSSSFEHIDPTLVGNERQFLLSEMSGRNTLLEYVREIIPDAEKDSPEIISALNILKEKEHFGYHYEAAEASLNLLLKKSFKKYTPHFEVLQYKTTDDFPYGNGGMTAAAMIEIKVGEQTEITAAVGNGPVNALDSALRRALSVFYPCISEMTLADFKVRVIDSGTSTAAKVRVLIESTDGVENWTTVGVSYDIIEACFTALLDSFEYKLSKT